MGHGDAGGDIFGEKELLHRHLVRLEGVDQFLHVPVDLKQPAGQGDPRRRGNHAVPQQGVFPPFRPDHAKPDGGHSGIDT